MIMKRVYKFGYHLSPRLYTCALFVPCVMLGKLVLIPGRPGNGGVEVVPSK